MRRKPLTKEQKKALEMTLDGVHWEDICKEMGLAPATYFRWRKKAAWVEETERLTRESVQTGYDHLKRLIPGAVATLGVIMRTGRTEAMRLGAAKTLLETMDRLDTKETQKAVVRELEDQLAAIKGEIDQGQLPAATEEVIEAEIAPIAHDSAHDQPEPAPERSKELK